MGKYLFFAEKYGPCTRSSWALSGFPDDGLWLHIFVVPVRRANKWRNVEDMCVRNFFEHVSG